MFVFEEIRLICLWPPERMGWGEVGWGGVRVRWGWGWGQGRGGGGEGEGLGEGEGMPLLELGRRGLA